MNVFLLPVEINKDIERSLTKYWWNTGQPSGSNISWMSWDRMTRHKSAGGLGFRNFRDFNLAMLGKQGWRFLSNPDSLVSKVYKARYFTDTDFLNSSLGSSLSFIWRSILAAKDVVAAGVRWRVGSGDQIRIMNQPWLLDKENPFITTVSTSIENQSVNSLMCVNRREWDIEVIRDVFNDRDQKCIMNVQIGGEGSVDTMFWNLESTGLYSVRSAYKDMQSLKGSWSMQFNDSIWRTLWKIKAPPKVLNLVWRALSHCLPTMVQLHQKHVPVQTRCQVCAGGAETTYHALVGCHFAIQCWKTFDTNMYIGGEMEFHVWFERVISTRNNEQRAGIVTLCWAIWRARNELVWNKKASMVNRVVATAVEYLTQWKAAQNRPTYALLQPMVDGDGARIWVKPQRNTVKVTVDAANFEDRNAYGIGLVARDWKGELIQAKTKLFQGEVRPEIVETIAIKEALSWVTRSTWEMVCIESDCLVAIRAIRSKIQMRSHFGVAIEECRQRIL